MGTTEPDALPDDLASWPTYVPSHEVLGRVELLLATINGEAAMLNVDVPAAIGEAADDVGHLVLTDEEGTPLADVAVETVSAGNAGASVRIGGWVRALRPFRSGLFHSLRRQPDELRRELAGASVIAVVLGQPLMAADERSLAAAADANGARLLLLPCVADVGPLGIPPEILVRAVQASLPRLGTPAGPALLVPLPLMPGDDTTPPPEADAFVKAAGGTLIDPEVTPDPGSAARIAAALDAEPGVSGGVRRSRCRGRHCAAGAHIVPSAA